MNRKDTYLGDKRRELADRIWKELFEKLEGDETQIDLAVQDLWHRRIKLHMRKQKLQDDQ